MSLTVCKFGGTSLANANNISRVANIVLGDDSRRIVVVSAPGKNEPADIKITDILFEIYYCNQRGGDYSELFDRLTDRFLRIEQCFGITNGIAEDLEQFKNEIPDKSLDFIASRGEYFMSRIVSKVLGYEFVDIERSGIIAFNECGEVDLEISRENFERFRGRRIVIAGFYGIDYKGDVKVFSRGGSDITGAIIANLADADVYENWTDVDGVYDRDPNKHADAIHYGQISFHDVEEMARNGANVLHPDCINFVQQKEIPIIVKNTFNPDGEGTAIS